MATDHIPVFVPVTEPQKDDKGRHWHRAGIVLGILFLTGAAIVFTVLSTRNREEQFANTTASVVSESALAAHSMPNIQPTDGAEASVPTASDAPTGDEVAGGAKTTGELETRGLPAEALFREFQVWAAEEDARTQVKPVKAVQALQTIEDTRAQEGQNARAEVRPSRKPRHAKPHHSAKQVRTGHSLAQGKKARAEIQPLEKHRQAWSMQKAGPKIHAVHNASPPRPVRNTQTEVRPEENADATWLERSFGWLY
jgi:hypothetical protein